MICENILTIKMSAIIVQLFSLLEKKRYELFQQGEFDLNFPCDKSIYSVH